MAWSRNRTIVGVAAAAAAGLGYYAVQLVRSRGGLATLWGGGTRPLHRAGSAALAGDGAEGVVGHSGAARDAGADSMRDPPERWSATDEAIDETFPASDPAPAKFVD
ncbi:hypothetical protein [Sphingosinicella sp. BN140058]|uniref:hypothetical protein n=1 Tax=Sphingosinicella sp. BN140058 TaxID=1892855 RepID=UPI001013880E|nr:hypothetical protein [Sphingosinicella sp. BN140058]QAY76662.1 hypothetical protein ETR14_09255 [Sphingosinicella sp. BN140058]